MLIILSDALDRPLLALFSGQSVLPIVPVPRLLFLIVWVSSLWLLAQDRRRAMESVASIWFLWPAVALAFASAAWSEHPAATMLWASALLGTSVFGVALAVRFTPEEQCALLLAALSSVALCSLLLAVGWPIVGLTGEKELQGLYIHQNLLGRVLALGLTVAATMVVSDGPRSARYAFALFACTLVTAGSRASTIAASIAAAFAVLLSIARKRPQHRTRILVGGAAAVVVAVALLIGTQPGLALIARSPTFSGRTGIWKLVFSKAIETPWLGHGYGAFWSSAAGQRASAQLFAVTGLPINHAHNGGLDLFAELGVVGVVLVLMPLVAVGIEAFRYALCPVGRGGIWPATYVVFFVASNAGESAFFRHKIFWALYVAAACAAMRRRPRASRAMPPGW